MSHPPYKHFTVIVDGHIRERREWHDCPVGPAFMSMKAWATSASEVAHMANVVAPKVGFEIAGSAQIYETEPAKPYEEQPFGYDIKFTPYSS